MDGHITVIKNTFYFQEDAILYNFMCYRFETGTGVIGK